MVRCIAIVLFILGGLTCGIAFALPPQWGPEQGDRPYDIQAPNSEEYLGQAIIQFDHALADVYHPDGKTVSFGEPELDNILSKYSVYFVRNLTSLEKAPKPGHIDLRWIYWLQYPTENSVADFLAEMKQLRCVKVVDPNYSRKLYWTPNDIRYLNQWHLTKMKAPQAWDYARGDSTIIISIVDSGVDRLHPDLAPNLWLNPDEDINHDGQITAADSNNVDNGGNTYRDDFWGWNFTNRNNNVNDPFNWAQEGGHGTHVAGCASAASNNLIGVAAPALVSKLLICRIGSDTDPRSVNGALGIDAWSYSRVMGARIINNSWGGSQPYNNEQNVLTECWNAGILVFGAAGNDSLNARRYPGSLTNAICVAASDQHDSKADFSNWGTWVAISAPGVAILSTVFTGTSHGYDVADGTSMASPVAAGCAALIWSVMPDADRLDVKNVLLESVDEIDSLNPSFAGRLGSGRINLFRAVASQFPIDTIVNFTLRDTINGNWDGRIEPGDTAAVVFSVFSPPENAGGINAYFKLVINDPSIVPVVDSIRIGDRQSGLEVGTNRMKFFVPSWVRPHIVTVRVLACGENNNNIRYQKEFSKNFMIGYGYTLLIDDDGGVNYEQYYTASLDSINQPWDRWDINTRGVPTINDINRYRTFIWWTGDRSSDLLTTDRQNLITWMQTNNRALLFSSKYAGRTIGNTTFHQNTMHASNGGVVTDGRVRAVTNDPLAQGLNLLLFGSSGAGNADSSSVLTPANGSTSGWQYATALTSSTVYYPNAQNPLFVYCGFPLEAIHKAGTYAARHTFIQRVLDSFNWVSVRETPTTAVPTGYSLSAPYPNPFNPSMSISFSVPVTGNVNVTVYDALGRSVTTLVDGKRIAGSYSLKWHPENVSSGLYLIRMTAGNQTITKKAMFIK